MTKKLRWIKLSTGAILREVNREAVEYQGIWAVTLDEPTTYHLLPRSLHNDLWWFIRTPLREGLLNE